jgi:hypothetical protein
MRRITVAQAKILADVVNSELGELTGAGKTIWNCVCMVEYHYQAIAILKANGGAYLPQTTLAKDIEKNMEFITMALIKMEREGQK